MPGPDDYIIDEAIARRFERERPSMLAAIMNDIRPILTAMDARIGQVDKHVSDVDAGNVFIIEQNRAINAKIDENDKLKTEKLDGINDLLMRIIAWQAARDSQEKTEEKYNNRDKSAIKAIAGLATGGGLVGAWHWISTHIFGGK